MNICALVYGDSQNNQRTLDSLQAFPAVTIVRVTDINAVNFHSIAAEYTFFMHSGDALAECACQLLTLHLTHLSPDILYSDEAWIYGHRHHKCFNFYKPDYSPELLLSMPYFRNLLCIKTELLQTIQKIDSRTYENWLYELALNVVPLSKKIVHIDEVLYYHYSQKKKITYADFFSDFDAAAGQELLENYCQKNSIAAQVASGRYHGTYRLIYDLIDTPLVSIIIPFRDQPVLLKACVLSIIEKSTYKNFEIIGIDNGSQETETQTLMSVLKAQDTRVKFYTLAMPFNYSKINNIAVHTYAQGDHIIFLNNDTAVITPEWIEALLEHSQRPEVGVVGAKLLYTNHTLQHCGMILGTLIGHGHYGLPETAPGYFYFPHVARNYHGVTFACAMVKTQLFKEVGGLNEVLAVAYNDVDFCARLSTLGYQQVYTPYAVLYHYESKSRGLDDTREKTIRLTWERRITMQQTPALFVRDTFYHKNLNQYDANFSESESVVLGCTLRFIKRLRIRYTQLGLFGLSRLLIKKLAELWRNRKK